MSDWLSIRMVGQWSKKSAFELAFPVGKLSSENTLYLIIAYSQPTYIIASKYLQVSGRK